MLGFVWFLGAIAVSTALGFVIHWLLTKAVRHRWTRIAVSTLPGLFVLVSAGIYLVFLQPAPAIDAPQFVGAPILEISYVSTAGKVIDLAVAYPRSMRANHDFTIYVTAQSNTPLEATDHVAYVSTSSNLLARTLQSCANVKPTSIEAAIPACASTTGTEKNVRFAWDVTPLETGYVILAFLLPEGLVPGIRQEEGGHRWLVTVTHQGQRILSHPRDRCIPWEPVPRDRGWDSDSDLYYYLLRERERNLVPIELSAQCPTLLLNGASAKFIPL
jgi:hypothetical protein